MPAGFDEIRNELLDQQRPLLTQTGSHKTSSSGEGTVVARLY